MWYEKGLLCWHKEPEKIQLLPKGIVLLNRVGDAS